MLGDGKMYGEFENKQLQNGQEYVFFVLAVVEMSENVRLISRVSLCLEESAFKS